jgi:hypothetical protein
MIENMMISDSRPKIQHHNIRSVQNLAIFRGRSPDATNNEDMRRFQRYLVSDSPVARLTVKKHGRRARSLFAVGAHTLGKIFIVASFAQTIVFLDQLFSPKLPFKPLLCLALRKGAKCDAF